MCRSGESSAVPGLPSYFKNCPAPSPSVCSTNLTVSDTFYGILVDAFDKVHRSREALQYNSAEFTALFHYYDCHLTEFMLSQNELSNTLDEFRAFYLRASDYLRTCYTVANLFISLNMLMSIIKVTLLERGWSCTFKYLYG